MFDFGGDHVVCENYINLKPELQFSLALICGTNRDTASLNQDVKFFISIPAERRLRFDHGRGTVALAGKWLRKSHGGLRTFVVGP